MLEQRDFEAITVKTTGVAAELLIEEFQTLADSTSATAQGSTDQCVPLEERLSEFIDEPDKSAGFMPVGNDTWLPKHLVDARKYHQRKVSRAGKSGIVWTK